MARSGASGVAYYPVFVCAMTVKAASGQADEQGGLSRTAPGMPRTGVTTTIGPERRRHKRRRALSARLVPLVERLLNHLQQSGRPL